MANLKKKSQYGVATEIRKYQSLINEIFYDKKLLEKFIIDPKHTESFTDSFNLYLEEINKKITQSWDKILEIILNSFNKGTKRVLNKKGEPVKFGEVKDKRAIEEVMAKQQIYLKNVSKAQAQKVQDTIIKGRNEGLSANQIAENITKNVKEITKSRAIMISRTEIVRSHNLGQVQVLKEAGIKYYEYITAKDNRVSEICKKWEAGGKYEVELAGSWNNPLPVISSHPNCRCSVVAS